MNEATYSRQFMKAWAEHEGCVYYHKIADVPMSMVTGMRYNSKRAVDYMVCVGGKFVAIEWKLIKNSRRLAFNSVREDQIETLEKVEDAGGVGLIMIGHYQDKQSAVYVIAVDAFVGLASYYELLGRKSAPLDDLEKYKISRVRVGRKLIWEFDTKRIVK